MAREVGEPRVEGGPVVMYAAWWGKEVHSETFPKPEAALPRAGASTRWAER